MATNQLTTKDFFARTDVRAKFEEMLGKRAPQFITSVLQIANSNALLKDADPVSIYNSAAVAATLDLPLNNQLGFAYIVPYNVRQKDGTTKAVAQFQLGYKGFIQLAQRTGQFRTIAATPIYEGQLVTEDPLRGFEFDFPARKSDIVIGYAAFFALINGFEKTLYMSMDDLKKHGKRYSKSFGMANGLWQTDFDAMAQKTVIKLLLSKFAPLSVEMQKAVISDQGVIHDVETDDVEYIDNEPDVQIDKATERVMLMIQDATTMADMKKIAKYVPEDLRDFYDAKLGQVIEMEGGAK